MSQRMSRSIVCPIAQSVVGSKHTLTMIFVRGLAHLSSRLLLFKWFLGCVCSCSCVELPVPVGGGMEACLHFVSFTDAEQSELKSAFTFFFLMWHIRNRTQLCHCNLCRAFSICRTVAEEMGSRICVCHAGLEYIISRATGLWSGAFFLTPELERISIISAKKIEFF